MKFDIIAIFLIVCFLLWIVLHLSERRRIVNGLFFFMSMGALLLLMLYIGIRDNIVILSSISAIILLGIVLLIPILIIVSLYLLFSTGIKLMKKEGISLSHGLSFLFGLGVLSSVMVKPFIMNITKNKIILIIVNVLFSCFSYFVIGFIVYLSASIIYNLYYTKKDKDYLIVLGSGLNKDKVTPLLAARVDKAIEFYHLQIKENNKKSKLVMSGGQGSDELVAESIAMKNYAIERGIPEEDIITEEESKTTEENLKFSMDIIEEDSSKDKPKILFFTTNYHTFRAALLAKSMDLDLNGKGSKVKVYFYISAIIREYIAALFMHKKLNIILCLFMCIINVLSII